MEVHVFECLEWDGDPTETEEMRPEWFALEDIPYDSMWQDDTFWLPRFLDGKGQKGEFYFNEKFEIVDHELREVDSLH